ncbi:DUF4105 domain-containing protein [Salinisphaera sp. S4-8]|uniref:Lnb N-terminal periplasmic domain-containing protein n=1 Tax=Salinisphaera sp. S4-8 TaxID=633357 RepID=UPI00334012A1
MSMSCFSSPWPLLGLILSLVFSAALHAQPQAPGGERERAIDAALTANLDRRPTWRRLLHIPPGREESEIQSPAFFLSPDGAHDARAELRATVAGWFDTSAAIDARPRCRFPARYHWLQSQLALPPAPGGDAVCPRFERWAQLADFTSVSVLMVSGYLGNPASSFGHSLMTFDHGDTADRNALLDKSFSFGALVPEQENMLAYMIRGFGGGYEAGFSDKLYYAEDQVYSHTEFRDIWRYRLDLTAEQRYMVAAHMYEIAAKKFRYFFLTKNCTYRMAELLTLATGHDFTPEARLWYVPIELFYTLTDTRLDGRRLVDKIDYIPSSQRRLYAQFAALDEDEAQAVNAVIVAPDTALADAFGGWPEARQQAMVDTLLAYYEYREAPAKDESTTGLEQAKRRALAYRLRLPVRERDVASPPTVAAPTRAHRPLRTGVGVAISDTAAHPTLHWAPYYRDDLSSLSPSVKVLVAGDMQISLRNGDDLRLDRLDFVRLRQLRINTADIAGESSLSWQLQASVDRDPLAGDRLGPHVAGGIGRAWAGGGHSVGYALLSSSARANDTAWVTGPEAGLVWRGTRVRAAARLHYGYDPIADETHTTLGTRAALPITRDLDMRFDLSSNFDAYRAAVNINRYW